MENFLITALIVVAFLITVAVLLQKSSSIGLGAYSGSNDSLFGARGPASFLAKITFFLGALFVALAVALSMHYNQAKESSVVDTMTIPAAPSVPSAPSVPAAPLSDAPQAPSQN
ncbi:MAG: preprotein translocase subunit SecG [Sulfuricurvum sp. PC08-66]|nr:MAG: preprotein translocase subunit SecG [Sulfuricurvum sp. PC08-66]